MTDAPIAIARRAARDAGREVAGIETFAWLRGVSRIAAQKLVDWHGLRVGRARIDAALPALGPRHGPHRPRQADRSGPSGPGPRRERGRHGGGPADRGPVPPRAGARDGRLALVHAQRSRRTDPAEQATPLLRQRAARHVCAPAQARQSAAGRRLREPGLSAGSMGACGAGSPFTGRERAAAMPR